MSENDELNELLSSAQAFQADAALKRFAAIGSGRSPGPEVASPSHDGRVGSLVQWTTGDGKMFVPAQRTVHPIPPGLYEVQHNPNIGTYFQAVPIRTEGLLRLPHTNSDRVLSEIQSFWERRDRFEEYGLAHKRGIMLWGPPGSGKSCTIQLVMRDVIARGGIGINFTHPELFISGLRILREIQPETPVVVLMEDIDSLIRMFEESSILNLLDGAERVDRVVFLASTNYPELLGPRILNRPSRFDRRVKVGHPDEASRGIYLRHLIGERRLPSVDIERWVRDTDGMSLAHLKELFVAVVILEDDYTTVIDLLRSMRENITSQNDGRRAGLL